MKWKIITAFLIISVLFFTLAVLVFPGRLQRVEEYRKIKAGRCKNHSENEDLKSIAVNIKSKFKTTSLDNLDYNQKQNKIDDLLADLNVDSISINDLSEIKWIYWELYVDPHLEDDITVGIDRIIKNKIDKIIRLNICGKEYPPMEMYIVTHIDADSYKCRLEDGYADDSFHLPEFSETYNAISYSESDVFLVNLNNDFRFVVEPHIYPEHSWKVRKVKNWNNNKFNLSSKLFHAVLFSIIEAKSASKRKYKVFWVLNYDKPPSSSFNSRRGSIGT